MSRALWLSLVALLVLAGCGSARPPKAGEPPGTRSQRATATATATPRPVLKVVGRGTLPAAVQLPGAAPSGSGVLLAGGLDAADSSVSDIVQAAPGRPRRIGSLPQAVHDAAVATLNGRTYVFGGGTASGPIDTITEIGTDGSARVVGRLPQGLSDIEAVPLGGTIYIVGGYTTTVPQRAILAFRPGAAVRRVAQLSYPVRYAAVTTAGRDLIVMGGTDGTSVHREITAVDPATGSARVIGRLPQGTAHAAAATLDGVPYLLGGRGDALDSQRRTILAVDPRTGRTRRAGRLPRALSDIGAATTPAGIVVAGGRDAAGAAQDTVWTLRPEAVPTRARRPARYRIPPLLDPKDIYAAQRPGRLAAAASNVPARVYVPNSESNTVDVIDQRTGKIVEHFATGRLPQHVSLSYDLRTLLVTNDEGNSLTPVDPRTSRPGRPVPVTDPYNLYFTADGRRAIVVAEARRELDFRAAGTMKLKHALPVPQCAGIDHMDYTADGRRALVSCEFSGRMVVLDLVREKVTKTIELKPGAMPQDVKISPDGRVFYVADMASNGVWLIDAQRMRKLRFQPTGRGAHGLYPSRDSRVLYVTNRGEGTITRISFATRRPVGKWVIPGGGSPDMGGLSADGKVLWLTGRYNAEVYAISTRTGRLLRRIPVGNGPHGLCVWPQPGRYSIGHTCILR